MWNPANICKKRYSGSIWNMTQAFRAVGSSVTNITIVTLAFELGQHTLKRCYQRNSKSDKICISLQWHGRSQGEVPCLRHQKRIVEGKTLESDKAYYTRNRGIYDSMETENIRWRSRWTSRYFCLWSLCSLAESNVRSQKKESKRIVCKW